MVNRALIVILATVTLDAVGIGLALPVIPTLLRELSHETRIAGRFGYFMAIYPFMQFLFSPALGRLSDRFGRRPVLLVSLGVASIDYLIMGLSPLLPVLYLGRVLAGMTGANLAVATAYIADISSPDARARRFGYMNACFGLGFVAGPLLGGLAGSFSARYPFLLAALFSGLNLLMGFFVLPESHKPGSEADQQGRSFVASLLSIRNNRTLLPLLTIYFLVNLIGQIPGSLWIINGEDRFGWDVWMVGLTFAAFGILHAVAQAVLHRADDPAIRRAGGDPPRGRLRLRGVRRNGADHEGVDGVRDHDPFHRGRDRLAGVSGFVVPAGQRGAPGRAPGDPGQHHEPDRGDRSDRGHEHLRGLASARRPGWSGSWEPASTCSASRSSSGRWRRLGRSRQRRWRVFEPGAPDSRAVPPNT